MQIAPYVSDRKKKRKRIRAYFFTAIGLIVLYGIFFVVQWVIFHSPIFRVDSVVVQGNSAVASADVIALAESDATADHDVFRAALTFKNMLLWPDAIPQKELQMIPQLASASISKDFFSHTVTITVTERSPFGIWCFSAPPSGAGAPPPAVASTSATTSTTSSSAVTNSNAPCYWFDNTGTLFERAGETQGSLFYVVYDSAQKPRGLNQEVLSDEFLPSFISIINVLRSSGLGVRAIELNDLSLQEVDVLTTNGPTIYFSLQFPADEYLPVIQKLMLQPGFDKLSYIDCRTQNRLFYK
jgi:hypothetical protein